MRTVVWALGIGVLLGVTGACGGEDKPKVSPTPCRIPPALDDLSRLPTDVPFAELGRVVRIEVRRGFLGAEAITGMPIVELFPAISRGLLEAGYEEVNAENEGFEAEIFFERGRSTDGAFRLREGPCEDQVTIKLLYGSPRYRRNG